jgi:broad specificity phosphatase PhoE
MNLTEIYLVRHGETVFNMNGRYQGQLDSPLTEYGVEQVSDVARKLRLLLHDMSEITVIASPLGRTLQTAQIICNTLGHDFSQVKTDDRLAEVSLGSWDGLTTSEIDEQFPGLLANTNPYNWYFNNPDGETYEMVAGRVSSWLNSIERNFPTVVAISHGLSGRVLRGVYASFEKTKTLQLDVSQDTIFKLSNGTIESIQSCSTTP